jgi:hypothetical protein
MIQLLAFVLTMCLLLAFLSCVALCSEHPKDVGEPDVTTNFASAVQTECCPLGPGERALLSERSKANKASATADVVAIFDLPYKPIVLDNTRQVFSSSPDPPLKTLPHLRI